MGVGLTLIISCRFLNQNLRVYTLMSPFKYLIVKGDKRGLGTFIGLLKHVNGKNLVFVLKECHLNSFWPTYDIKPAFFFSSSR